MFEIGKKYYRDISILPAALGHVENQNTPFILVDFLANFPKFQNFAEQPIFVVQKSLPYEKASIFDEKYDAIKIK